MKAIFLWQPWASLMAAGLKTIETRSWATQYRGPLAIHAAKRPLTGNEKTLMYVWACKGLLGPDWITAQLPFGAIVAVVDLVSCVPTNSVLPGRQDEAFGNYGPGRWAWITQDVRRLAESFPYCGAQGLFAAEFPRPDIANAIEPAIAHATRRCRLCGCTDDDCRQCIEKTGQSCHWVEPDLCSACKGAESQEGKEERR